MSADESIRHALDSVQARLSRQLRLRAQDRAHLTETIWLVAEAFGADRECAGCQKVVRDADRRKICRLALAGTVSVR